MRALAGWLTPLVLAVLAVGLAACATLVPSPRPTGAGAGDPLAAWHRILHTHVLEDGRIDFVGLRQDPRDLEAYVAWVAIHGPRATPELFSTQAARLAYYINAYNAVAMYQVVRPRTGPSNGFGSSCSPRW